MKKLFFTILSFVIIIVPFVVNAEECDLDKVSISSIKMYNRSNTVTEIDDATVNDKNINLNLSMVNVGDDIKYKIIVKNDSNELYELDKNSLNVDSDYLEYSIESEDNSNIVKGNSTKSFLLNVKYKKQIPDNKFVNGEYNENKSMSLVLSTGSLSNPDTFSNIFVILFIILTMVIITVSIINKKKISFKSMILIIGLLFVPFSVSAICKCEITINSKITIEGHDPYEVDNGPYYNINKDKKYPTLAIAVDRARSNQTIKVLDNVYENTTVNIPESLKGLKLDLNGKYLDFEQVYEEEIITNNGEIEIYNSGDGVGELNYSALFVNNGILDLKSGISLYSLNSNLENHGIVNMSGGDVVGSEGYGIQNTGILNMTGGKYWGNCAIENSNIANIYSGSTYGMNGICNTENGHLILGEGADILGMNSSILNSGIVDANGGHIGVNYAYSRHVINNSGTANFKNTSITFVSNYSGGQVYAINNEDGELNIESSTIDVSRSGNSNASYFGIYNKASANISGTTINMNINSYEGVGIGSSGVTNINSGTINAARYCIQVMNNGNVTLGKNDNDVDITTPLLNGTGTSTSGVYIQDGGTFNFYDGIIKITNNNYSHLIDGTVTNLPIGYSIKNDVVDNKKVAYLGLD